MDVFLDKLLAEGVLTQDEAASLTPGEAITATQAAIWSFGNSDLSFTVDPDVVIGPALKSYSFNSLDWDWRDSYIENGNVIKKIYDFLIIGTLESSAQTTVLTKYNSITDFSLKVKEKISDGTDLDSEVYKVDLSFELGTDVLADDNLKVITKQGDDIIAEIDLEEGRRTYTLNDLNITENSEISFYLEGTRLLEQSVYLFESPDPSVAQTLVGVASGTQYVGLKRCISYNVTPEAPYTNGIEFYTPWIIAQILSFAFLISALITLPKYIYCKRG